MNKLIVLAWIGQAACWTGAPAIEHPAVREGAQRAETSPAPPRPGRHMCQVEVDGKWDRLHPCGLFETTRYSNRIEGRLALGYARDFAGHKLESLHVELVGRSIVMHDGIYHVADHLREGEDYGFCVKGRLEQEPGGWVGELVFKDCGGGMRDERWPGTRRFAIRRHPWPASFSGELWPGMPES